MYQKYLDYIRNTGGVSTDQFDEDWEPIGPMVRRDLVNAGLITQDICTHRIKIVEESNGY